jgi:hypothetical protein
VFAWRVDGALAQGKAFDLAGGGHGTVFCSPLSPMDQLAPPGGSWTMMLATSLFHSTDQPMAQPWLLPISPRFMRLMAGAMVPSMRRPVDQR